jgi:hypothetical protein
MKEWIKNNYLRWIFNGIKSILVAYFSYYLLKGIAEVGFIEGVWSSNERVYLASYATIQIVVTFILYTGCGKLFEHIIYRWIRSNEEELIVKLNKEDEKDIKKIVSRIAHILKFFKIINWADLVEFDGLSLDKEEFRKKWKNTVEVIKSVAGILVLALTNFLVFYDSTFIFIWLAGVFIFLSFLSIVVLLVFYFLIENLHLVNLSFKSMSATGRLIRRNDKTPKLNS